MVFALNFPAAQAWINGVEGGGASAAPKASRSSISQGDDAVVAESGGREGGGEDGNQENGIDNNNNNGGGNDDDDDDDEKGVLIQSDSAQHPARGFQKAKIYLLLPLLLAFFVWAYFVYTLPKRAYNAWHPYFFFIPLLTYVVVRNFTPCLRSHHSSTLAFMGKITLETYLMQHHVWLAQNAKALFVVVPGFPVLNLFITTVTFIYVAWRLFRITIGLRAMHIPNNRGPLGAILGVSAVGVAVMAAYMLSYVLIWSGVGFTGFVLAFVLVSLPLLLGTFFVLHQRFWSKNHSDYAYSGVGGDAANAAPVVAAAAAAAAGMAAPVAKAPSRIVRVVHGLLLVSVLLQIGAWTTSALFGGPAWGDSKVFDADDKMTTIRAKALFKSYGQDMFVPTRAGAEHKTKGCPGFIDKQKASALLRDRDVYFVGDSLGRNTMLALGRALEPSSGETPDMAFTIEDRHRDKTFELKSGFMWTFYWSPFAAGSARRITDDVFADITKRAATTHKTPVVLVSNGLWDMLHHGGPEGPLRFGLNAQRLALAMREGGSVSGPGSVHRMWLVPTIVEPSKLAPHKRKNMTVKACREYRSVVLGIDGIRDLDVLDGLTFSDTPDIRSLSVDGVHFEDEVYDALAQGVLNTISFREAAAEEEVGNRSEAATSRTCASGKGGGGGPSQYSGIGYSPTLGLLIVLMLVAMLVLTDSYAGAARLALHLQGGFAHGYAEMYAVAYARLRGQVQQRPVLW